MCAIREHPPPGRGRDAVGKHPCIAHRCVLRTGSPRQTAPGSLPGSAVPDRRQEGQAGREADEPKQRPTENKRRNEEAKEAVPRPYMDAALRTV